MFGLYARLEDYIYMYHPWPCSQHLQEMPAVAAPSAGFSILFRGRLLKRQLALGGGGRPDISIYSMAPNVECGNRELSDFICAPQSTPCNNRGVNTAPALV